MTKQVGISGIILKRKEKADIQRLIQDVKLAAERADLEPRIKEKFFDSVDGGVYTTGNIADTYEDIERIKKSVYDPMWCYKNPHTKS